HPYLHFTQRRVGLAEAVLITLILASDVDAVAARVERPLMKDAGHPFGIAGRIVEDRIAAMRTDVVERAHFRVIAANDDQRHAARMIEQPIVERRLDLGLMAGDDPRRAKELLLLFLENRAGGVDARLDEMRRW